MRVHFVHGTLEGWSYHHLPAFHLPTLHIYLVVVGVAVAVKGGLVSLGHLWTKSTWMVSTINFSFVSACPLCPRDIEGVELPPPPRIPPPYSPYLSIRRRCGGGCERGLCPLDIVDKVNSDGFYY